MRRDRDPGRRRPGARPGREGPEPPAAAPRARRLLWIAEAIERGGRVDWQAEGAEGGAAGAELANLEALEAVVAAHGGLGKDTQSAGATRRKIAPPPATPPAGHPEAAIGAWGPLLLLERIGSGGFGEVFRAYDPTLQRQVALKLRAPGRADDDPAALRFVREARMLARVHHPNVLVVHGADQHGGRAGLWTDLLHGRTLEQILLDQGPFSAREAALIGIDMCAALAAVHAAGIVHRDVKTGNIMREQGGRIVLMDFGSGGEQSNGRPASAHISSAGTPLYMAPEQILEAAEASASTDLYALGVVLHRLVSGRHPVEAVSFPDLIERHRRRETVPLVDARPDLPPIYAHVVERALARNPARRYASAGSMERDLRAVLGAGFISTPGF